MLTYLLRTMPVSEQTEELRKMLPSSILKAAGQRARRTVDAHIQRAEAHMEAMVSEMTGKAIETIRSASKVGPKIAGQLNGKVNDDLSLEQLESASRTWDRLMMSSRKVLGMDETVAAQVNIAVVSLPDRAALRQAIDVESAATAAPIVETLPATFDPCI